MPAKEESKKTTAGPHGGGNKYNQMTVKNTYFTVSDRPSGKYGKKADDYNGKRKTEHK